MYYISYLASLCKRRRWPDPHYDVQVHPAGGYTCTVRVNHRDYSTDATDMHATVELAHEAAAQRAYMITRDISAYDSMYGPGAPAVLPPAPLLPPSPPGSSGSSPPSHHIHQHYQASAVPANMAQPRYVPDAQQLMYTGNAVGVQSVQAQGAGQQGIPGQHMGGVMVGHHGQM